MTQIFFRNWKIQFLVGMKYQFSFWKFSSNRLQWILFDLPKIFLLVNGRFALLDKYFSFATKKLHAKPCCHMQITNGGKIFCFQGSQEFYCSIIAHAHYITNMHTNPGLFFTLARLLMQCANFFAHSSLFSIGGSIRYNLQLFVCFFFQSCSFNIFRLMRSTSFSDLLFILSVFAKFT